MTVIRSADAGRLMSEALVLDLGDLVRQGDQLRRRSEEEAARIVQQGQQERQRLLAGAREEGLAQGIAEGRAKGVEQGRAQGTELALGESREVLAKLTANWTSSLDEFVTDRERMLREAKDDVIRLALLIAQKVTHRLVQTDPTIVASQLESVLSMLARRSRLIVQLNPADEPLVRKAIPGLLERFPMAEHLELVMSESVSRGSVSVRTATGGGTIDASIQTQLDRIAAELVPDPAANLPIAAEAPSTSDVSPAAPLTPGSGDAT